MGERVEFLCAFLNSSLGHSLVSSFVLETGTGDLLVSVQAFARLPVPKITDEEYGRILSLFLRRLSGEYVDEEIDEAFFDLFAFEKEERDYISREYR